MKIITDGAVYVQKNDIGFLNQTNELIPASIFLKVFGRGVTIIDNSNRFEFVKFEEETEIDFFKSLDWIIDYASIKDLDDSQIIRLYDDVLKQRNEIANKYNSMSKVERRKNQRLVLEFERLDFKLCSLRDALWYKQGHIKFDLPKEITSFQVEKKKEEKVLRKIFKKNN